MTRIFRSLLYWLALVAGLIGLAMGGRSLVKYALARLNDPYFDAFSYNDLVFSGGVIFLLSLLLLIVADLARTLGGSLPGGPEKPGSTPTSPGESRPASGGGSAAVSATGAQSEPDRISADEKLARLLKQKGE